MIAGGMLASCSFFISGFLELEMMKTYEQLPSAGESHVHFMNNLPSNVSIHLSNQTTLMREATVGSLVNLILTDIHPGSYGLDIEVPPTCLPDILTLRKQRVPIQAL